MRTQRGCCTAIVHCAQVKSQFKSVLPDLNMRFLLSILQKRLYSVAKQSVLYKSTNQTVLGNSLLATVRHDCLSDNRVKFRYALDQDT